MPRQYSEHTTYEYMKKVSPEQKSSNFESQKRSYSKDKGHFDVNNNPIYDHGNIREDATIDDEYNPYRYGFRPLSERNIYRSFEVILSLPGDQKQETNNNSQAKVTRIINVPTTSNTVGADEMNGFDERDSNETKFKFTEQNLSQPRQQMTKDFKSRRKSFEYHIPIVINERPIDVPGINSSSNFDETNDPKDSSTSRLIEISMPGEEKTILNARKPPLPLPFSTNRRTSTSTNQQRTISQEQQQPSSYHYPKHEIKSDQTCRELCSCPYYSSFPRVLNQEPIPTTLHSYKCTKYELKKTNKRSFI